MTRNEGLDLTQTFKSQTKARATTRTNRPADEFMKQAGKLRQAVNRLQLRIATASKDKNAASLFAASDYSDELLISVKSDLAALPTQIGDLQTKGKQIGINSDMLKALVAIFHSEMIEAGRDFGKLVERHAHAAKTKEDKRNRLDIGRNDQGSLFS